VSVKRRIRETAEALVRQYASPGYSKYEIIQYTLKSYSLKRLRRLTRYFYHDTVPLDHNDWLFFFKLVGWAIVERSMTLTEEALFAQERHRKALLKAGPLPDNKLTSKLGNSHKKRKRRKRRIQEKNYMAKKLEKKANKLNKKIQEEC